MARKKITLEFLSPVTVFFSLMCALVFILYQTGTHSIVETFFSVGGNASSSTPFERNSIYDYITIFTHVFGHTSGLLLTLNLTCILLLGPNIENAYGKGLTVLMLIIVAFITGVLSTVLVDTSVTGAQGIVCLFLILTILSYAKTKSICVSILFVCILYLVSIFGYTPSSSISAKIVPMIGALCASVFGFIDFFEQTKPVQRKKKE